MCTKQWVLVKPPAYLHPKLNATQTVFENKWFTRPDITFSEAIFLVWKRDFTSARPSVHTASAWLLTRIFLHYSHQIYSDSLFPNYPSPLVPINTCRRLSFLIGSLPGLLSVRGGGGEVSHKDASETHLKNKSSKVHYFHRSDPPLPQHKHPRCPPPRTDDLALEVRGEGSLWASTTPP